MAEKYCIDRKMPMGRHLAILTKMYYGALTKRLEHLEIEKHFSLLIFVEGSDIKCTQQYISDRMKIDKASMVNMIDYLAEKHFIKRTNNPDDRREYWIELTSKAITVLPEIHKVINELNKLALKGLNKTKAEEFNEALDIISGNLFSLPSNKVIIKYKKVKKKR
jgi:MarR family transcriptional regulator for hemolysin